MKSEEQSRTNVEGKRREKDQGKKRKNLRTCTVTDEMKWKI